MPPNAGDAAKVALSARSRGGETRQEYDVDDVKRRDFFRRYRFSTTFCAPDDSAASAGD